MPLMNSLYGSRVPAVVLFRGLKGIISHVWREYGVLPVGVLRQLHLLALAAVQSLVVAQAVDVSCYRVFL